MIQPPGHILISMMEKKHVKVECDDWCVVEMTQVWCDLLYKDQLLRWNNVNYMIIEDE